MFITKVKSLLKKIFNGRFSEGIFFVSLFMVVIGRYSSFGLKYFNYTDDNNQYGVYFRRAMSGDIWGSVIMHYKRYIERPLAFISDAYIFQRFYNNMYVLLFIITLMHVLICYFIYKIFERFNQKLSVIAVLIIGILPCLYEGAYWISASSRIVVSMFFGTFSAYLFFVFREKMINLKVYEKIVLYLVIIFSSLFSLLYYEQTALYSCSLFFVCAVFDSLEKKKVSVFIKDLIIPVTNAFVMAGYYIFFMFFTAKGLSESRNKISETGISERLLNTTKEIAKLCYDNLIAFNVETVKLGFSNFPKGQSLFILALILFFSLVLIYFSFIGIVGKKYVSKDENNKWVIRVWLKMLAGFTLFFAPLIIFYPLENIYFEPRMLFSSIVGIGVMVDCLFDILVLTIGKLSYKMTRVFSLLTGIVVSALIIPFVFSSIYITGVYKTTKEIDDKIANSFVLEYSKLTSEEKEKLIVIQNTKYNFTGFKYPPLGNITSSDWVFLGKINSLNIENIYLTKIVLVGETQDFPEINEEYVLFVIDENQEIKKLLTD